MDPCAKRHIWEFTRSEKRKIRCFLTAKWTKSETRVGTKHWLKHYIRLECADEVAEWLRRWTANAKGSARVGAEHIALAVYSILVDR